MEFVDGAWVRLAFAALVAIAMSGISVYLLVQRPGNAVYATFGTFLFLYATRTVGFALAPAIDGPAGIAFGATASVAQMLVTPALAAFLVAYLVPPKWPRNAALLLLGLLGIGAVVQWFVDSCTFFCTTPATTGWLMFLGEAHSALIGVAATLFAWRVATGVSGARRGAEATLALAFAVYATLRATAFLLTLVGEKGATYAEPFAAGPWAIATLVVRDLTIPLAVGAIVGLAVAKPQGVVRWTGGGLLAIAVVAGIMISLPPIASSTSGLLWVGTGLTGLVFPALVCYGLTRHSLFGLDKEVRWCVSRSLVAGTFVATFFGVTESAAAVVESETNSALIGILSASVLVFVISPLQSVADRIGRASVPTSDAQRAREIYREQAAIVWADGVMGAKERMLLDRLRERMDLPAEVALSLEADVIQSRQSGPRAAAV